MTIDSETRDLVAGALAEDLGTGDVTAEAIVPGDVMATATIIQKQAGIVFGMEVVAEVFRQTGVTGFDPLSEGQWLGGNGVMLMDERGETWEVPPAVARATGPARALLAAERTALNFLGHLSGIATLTARFVRAVQGTGVKVLDTRKTTPGLRRLEKAAVAAGGGTNHRMGLHDAILIKENHATLVGGVGKAVRRARETRPEMPIEVECRDLDEIREAVEAGAGRLLLDNMTPAELQEAVAAVRRTSDAVELEASGGITLENVGEIAASGVDYVSIGALTHSAPALDLSMGVE